MAVALPPIDLQHAAIQHHFAGPPGLAQPGCRHQGGGKLEQPLVKAFKEVALSRDAKPQSPYSKLATNRLPTMKR